MINDQTANYNVPICVCYYKLLTLVCYKLFRSVFLRMSKWPGIR